MTPALPDIFIALAKLIPHRVEWTYGPDVHDGFGQVMWRGMPHYVYWKGGEEHGWESDQVGEALFEYALREECAARGWRWQVTSDSDNGLFGSEIAAQLAPQGRASYFYAGEPTPAQSLAICLLAALNAAQAVAVAADRQAHPESKFDEVGFEESAL